MEGSRESVEGVEEEWEGCRARERSDGPSRALQQITALLKRNVIVRARQLISDYSVSSNPAVGWSVFVVPSHSSCKSQVIKRTELL